MGIWKAKLMTNLTFTFLKLKKTEFQQFAVWAVDLSLDFFTETQIFQPYSESSQQGKEVGQNILSVSLLICATV